LKIDPTHDAALEGLADAFYYDGRIEQAVPYFQHAVDVQPADLKNRIRLARLYARLEYDHEAVRILEYVLGTDPQNLEAHCLICEPLRYLNRAHEAHSHAKIALRLSNYDPKIYFYIIGTLRQTLEWDEIEKLKTGRWDDINQPERRLRKRTLVGLLADSGTRQETQKLLHISRSEPRANQINPITSSPGKQKFRVGFVCQELRQHPVGNYFRPLLQAYTAGLMPNIEIFVYNTGDEIAADPVQQELKKNTGDRWRILKGLPLAQTLEMIRGDEIDVLFDLGGHSPRAAAWMFEARLAAIQIMWLGWGHSVGSPGIDYLLADPYCAPIDSDSVAEKLAILPAPYMQIPEMPALPKDFIPPILRNGYATVGYLNRFDKLTPATLDRDAQVLKAMPDTRVLIFRPDAENSAIKKNLTLEFMKRGISADRLTYKSNTPAEYAECIGEIDMVMDPIDVSGGATTMDLLSYGVPVIACAGSTMFKRFSYSFLRWARLDELCAHMVEDSADIAFKLLQNPRKLAALRGGGVREAVASSPLCDRALYGASWNALIPKLIHEHFQGQAQRRAR
jgi:predicted O-linked N-acetylglucosamine transferase (SPINDLY family)